MEAASTTTGSSSGLQGISDPIAYRIMVSSADLAIVLDREGTIVDVWLGAQIEDDPGWSDLIGESWVDTVMPDSQAKVGQLVRQAFTVHTTRAREVNQRVEGVGEVPVRFTCALVDDDHVVALGHDLRPLAELQQQMVSAQQAMDLEYRRLRQADTRYRVLFRVCSEGVLVVRGDDRRIIEANPAAAAILGQTADSLRNQRLGDLFSADARDDLLTLLGAVEAGAQREVALVTKRGEAELTATASMFRQSGGVLLLLRFWPANADASPSERVTRMMSALDAIPDGFVVTDRNMVVLSANTGFCELVQQAAESQVVGNRLDRWLGRPGVDLNIILANLQERGVVRDFSTIIRGEFDAEQEAIVSAVSALDGSVPSFGFVIRTVTTHPIAQTEATTFLPRSVENLRGLVGRVSLKEIVKESTDLIERLCIEAALEVSNNNRAAAAQLLGLSRQSLYSKLRRHGLGESS